MKRTAPLLVLALTSSMLVTSPSTADSLSGATLSWRKVIAHSTPRCPVAAR